MGKTSEWCPAPARLRELVFQFGCGIMGITEDAVVYG